ncbi:MAG TPA: hypothetical protein VFR39_03075 [Burkholderiales bacterium]|nr:hypothetical protein [Burkholderiales bacterium]
MPMVSAALRVSSVARPQAVPLLRASPRYTLAMNVATRAGVAFLLCLPLTGCYVKTHGLQSTSGGTTTTVTSSQVVGVAKFSGGAVAFSSGQVPPSSAPGGHLRWSGTTSGSILVGAVFVGLLGQMVGWNQPNPLPEGTKIMHTCSCFKQEEVKSDK